MSAQPASGRFLNRRLTPDELAAYNSQGFLLIDGLLPPDGVAALRDACMEVWQRIKGTPDPGGTWLQAALLPDVHHHNDLVREFYFRGPLVEIATQLIGPNIKGATSQLTFKLRGNTKPFGWHQDNGYGRLTPENAITTLTALEDNDLDTGCLWLIPGSHKQGQIDLSDRLTPEAKTSGADLTVEVADESGAQPMPMRAGQTLIFHCHMLHKSDGNHSLERDRRILFLRYADADAVETYNDDRPRLGRLLRGKSRFPEVTAYEAELEAAAADAPSDPA